MTALFNSDQFIRISELANYPARPERTYTYKSGELKGQTKRISARPESKGIIGVSDKTIWLWVKQDKFPAPLKLSDGVTVWRMSDVQAWMQAKAKAMEV